MTEKRMPFILGMLVLPVQNAFRHYKRLLFPHVPVGFEKKDEALLSAPGLFRLSLVSSLLFAFAFLLVRAVSVLVLTGLLRFNGINHLYSIFNIVYLPGDDKHWSDGNLLMVYGLPAVLYLAAGMYLVGVVVRVRTLNWIFRLLLSWIAFSLIVFFLSELFLAPFFYKGFGIAMQWLISNAVVRVVLILVGIVGIVVWSKRFGLMFLRSCPSRIFVSDTQLMRTWLIWVVLVPVFTGSAYTLLIMFYSLKVSLATGFIAALITLPLAFRSIDYLPDVRIYKSKKAAPGFLVIVALMIVFGVMVRILVHYV